MSRVFFSHAAAKRKRIKGLITAVLLILAALLLWFFVSRSVRQREEEKYLASFDQTALTVGNYEVTFDLYRYFYLNYRDTLSSDYKNADGTVDSEKLDSAVRGRMETALRGLYGMVALAEDYGMTPQDSDVRVAADEYMEATLAYYTENELDFAAELEENYMTQSVYEFLMRLDALEDKLFDAIVREGRTIKNTDEEIAEILRGDDFVRAKQIYIENDKGEDIEENRRIAEEALEKYLSGDSFDMLVGLYSEDTAMPSDGYYFTYLEMIDEFESAAFALDDGEVSQVFESEGGYHIILRLAKDEAYIDGHFDQLKTQYQNSAFYRIIEQRANRMSVSETALLRQISAKEIR